MRVGKTGLAAIRKIDSVTLHANHKCCLSICSANYIQTYTGTVSCNRSVMNEHMHAARVYSCLAAPWRRQGYIEAARNAILAAPKG